MRTWTLIVAIWASASTAHAELDVDLLQNMEQSLRSAATYLVSRQDEDGGWHSSQYVFFEDGLALTPITVTCLHALSQYGLAPREPVQRGAEFLAAAANREAKLEYPVYISAAASWAVVLDDRSPPRRAAQAAWVATLRTFQLGSGNGWTTNDACFGGWGFNPRPPIRPDDGPGPWSANLSATLFALGALRASGAPTNDPAVLEALAFVRRCHNEDGGFCFTPEDEAANKAGGRRSYGSATADGLRCLVAGGVPLDDPAVRAARNWLVAHFDVKANPGDFAPGREGLRDAYYYYYLWSAAHAFHVVREQELDWAAPLAREVIRRQGEDGSWSNRWTDAREDDPMVGTPLAAAALAVCRRSMLVPVTTALPPAHGAESL